MEPIFKEPNSVTATEILYFPEAEILKTKGDYKSFAASGPLSVLYFKDYDRFMFQINDWKYPLLRRLPIMGADQSDMRSRMYHLPGRNGYMFNLKITNIPSSQALQNLELLMRENSGFYFRGEDISSRKLETSPDDKLMRMTKKEMPSKPGMVAETIKMGFDKAKIAGKTLKDGTKGLGKKRILLKDIKRRNYRDTTHPTFKKDWFETHEKMTKDIHVMRKHNFSNFKQRTIDELRHADHLPVFYLPREDIEETILVNKDLADTGKFNIGGQRPMERREEKKGLISQIKEGIHDIKENISGRIHKDKPDLFADPMKISHDTMTHYEA